MAVRTTGAGPPTGVVTFLLSDVEGSTALWAHDETMAAAVIARHYELLDAAIDAHSGVRPVEQGEGDSVVGAFARPSDAVAAALDAQRAFGAEPWPDDFPLRIRVALHTGEAQVRAEEDGGAVYAGRAVIRCARLRALAHGGQTLLSGTTRDMVSDRLPDGVFLRDLGMHRLKGLDAPERVWQLCHPDLSDAFAPVHSVDTAVRNLPAQLTTFLGRDRELAELSRVLESSRLVTLTGTGGAGKTRLAAHTVAAAAGRHRDGAWWVDLAALTDPDMLPFTVARSLGLRLESSRPALDALCERLVDSEALLVLDNCEHLVAVCALLTARLLGAVPSLQVLATSREPLDIPGEVIWRVPPLSAQAARDLFVERAGNVRPGFSVADPDDARAVAAVCNRLDGIPLAIELAAARVRMMSPALIAEALDDRFALLTGGGRTALPRQQTLALSVAWSHDLLDSDERVLLRRLAVFAGGFTVDAVEQVCDGSPILRVGVFDLITRLCDKSLIHVEQAASGRYRLLETIRLYAAERLREAGEDDAFRARHLAYYLASAESTADRLGAASSWDDQHAALDRVSAELDNLRAAYRYGIDSGEPESSLRIATALGGLWRMKGQRVEGATWLDEALSAAGPVSPERRVRALIARSRIETAATEQSADRVDEAIALARKLGDPALLAGALVGGTGYMARGPQPYLPHLDEATRLAAEAGDHPTLVNAQYWLAIVKTIAGEPGAATRDFDVAAGLAREGVGSYLAHAITAMQGMALCMRGHAAAAVPALRKVVAESARLGERTVTVRASGYLGWALALAGDHAAADEVFAGGEIEAAAGDNIVELLHRLSSGMGALAGGVPERAEEEFGRAIALQVAPGFTQLLFGPQAEALLVLGRPAEARAIADQGIAATADPLLPWQAAWARQARARVALAEGDVRAAEDFTLQALDLRVRIEDNAGIADSLEFLAVLTATRDRVEATRLLAAAETVRAEAGCVRFGIHRREGALADELRDEVDAAVFEEVWRQGLALDPAEAVSHLRRGKGSRRRPGSGWDALTPAEVEIAHLVADGLRNKEIAQRLFVSPRTVQAHLSSTFAKLGLSSRVQLAQEVTRQAGVTSES